MLPRSNSLNSLAAEAANGENGERPSTPEPQRVETEKEREARRERRRQRRAKKEAEEAQGKSPRKDSAPSTTDASSSDAKGALRTSSTISRVAPPKALPPIPEGANKARSATTSALMGPKPLPRVPQIQAAAAAGVDSDDESSENSTVSTPEVQRTASLLGLSRSLTSTPEKPRSARVESSYSSIDITVKYQPKKEELKNFISEEGSEPADLKRMKVLNEILNTERDYVRDLVTIREVFLMPIRDSKCLSEQLISTIFSNITTLLNVNKTLLKEFSDTAAKDKGDSIGLCFIHLADYLKMYSIYCFAGNTHVTLASGVSMRIADLVNFMLPTLCFGDPALSVRVLSLGNSDTFVSTLVSGQCLEPQARACLKLVFSDGRVIVCTPDHHILTPSGYVEAQALKKDDRVVVGPDAPLYDPAEDLPGHLYRFQLHLPASAVTLQMRTLGDAARVHAFARVLGYFLTDGTMAYIPAHNVYTGGLYLGHAIDVARAVADVELAFGVRATVHTSEKCSTYRVNLPSPLLRDFHEVLGIPRGKRVLQAMSLPSIFLSAECPKSVVREFLGGLFGGGGTAPLPTEKGWTSIGFSMSRIEEHTASIALVFEQVKRMLQRFNINGGTEHVLHDVTESHQNAVSCPGVRFFAGYLYLPVEAVLPFQENVGFRLCAHKQQRATVAAAFFRARAYSCEQRQRFIEHVRELTNYQNAPVVISAHGHARRQLAMSITAAIDITRAEMAKSEIYINENVAIPSYYDVQAVLQERDSIHSTGERSVRMCPYDWLAAVGAGSSFSERVFAPPPQPRQSSAASPLTPVQRTIAPSCEKRKATEGGSKMRIGKLFIVGKQENGFSNANEKDHDDHDDFKEADIAKLGADAADETMPDWPADRQTHKVRCGVSRAAGGFHAWTAVFVGSKPAGTLLTYDITVPSTHNFLAGGVVVHNCNNQDLALQTCRQQMKDNEKFRTFVQQQQNLPACKRNDLQSYLIKPVQRLCKYPLLLRELIKCTPADHPDRKRLDDAFTRLEAVVAAVEEGRKKVDTARQMQEIKTKMLGAERLDLVTPTRHFVKEGTVHCINEIGTMKELHVVLFNDILLVARLTSSIARLKHHKDPNCPYLFRHIVNRSLLLITPIDPSEIDSLDQHSSLKHRFRIEYAVSGKIYKRTFAFGMAEQKVDWLGELQRHEKVTAEPATPRK